MATVIDKQKTNFRGEHMTDKNPICTLEVDGIRGGESDIHIPKSKPAYDFIKRLFDIVFSIISIVIFSPAFIAVALAIKINDGGPVLYTSQRVGKNGKVFNFYKFRSMSPDADVIYEEIKHQTETKGPTFKLENDPRVTKVGRFIRKTSLDELPQFFNILAGNMSFVGPRPPLVREVEQYGPKAMQRLSVKGGLTCFWQVMGRSEIDFDGMVELDLEYIDKRGFLTDIKILFLTIPAVFMGKGAY